MARPVDVLVVGAGGGLDVRPPAPQREGDEPVGRVDGEVQRQRPLADGAVGERSGPGLVEVAVQLARAGDPRHHPHDRDPRRLGGLEGHGDGQPVDEPVRGAVERPDQRDRRPIGVDGGLSRVVVRPHRGEQPLAVIARAHAAGEHGAQPGGEAGPRVQRVTQGGVEPRADRTEPDEQQD